MNQPTPNSHPSLPTDDPDTLAAQIAEITEAGAAWGHSSASGEGQAALSPRVLVEFVSAPPNAPLSVAHGRGGVVGDVLAALFTAIGAQVHREFYSNDAPDSRPLRTLARAVFARYRDLSGSGGGETGGKFAASGDDYPAGVADRIADALFADREDGLAALPPSDALPVVQAFALEYVATEQRAVLDELGIRFDSWFSDRDLQERGTVAETVETLVQGGHATRHADGSIWLLSSRFGDESDRVLIRADGTPTYLAGDLAYHRDKIERGFERLVDVWGSDHAAYVARTRAGLSALGIDAARLDIVLCYPVRLLRDGTEVKGAGASGSPTLRDLIEQVGADTARFALLLQPAAHALDINIDNLTLPDAPLARVRTARNHARDRASAASKPPKPDALAAFLQSDGAVRALVAQAASLPEIVRRAAETRAPQQIAQYAVELAGRWAGWHPGSENEKGGEIAAIAGAVAIALENALALAGVTDALPVTVG